MYVCWLVGVLLLHHHSSIGQEGLTKRCVGQLCRYRGGGCGGVGGQVGGRGSGSITELLRDISMTASERTYTISRSRILPRASNCPTDPAGRHMAKNSLLVLADTGRDGTYGSLVRSVP